MPLLRKTGTLSKQPGNNPKIQVTCLHCQMTLGQSGWDVMKHVGMPFHCGRRRRGEPSFDTVAHFPVTFSARLRLGLRLIGKAVNLRFY